jgi:hypothetical protein
MADAPRLDTPYVEVTYADGRVEQVQTENPDMVYFDLERAKRKWPTFQDAPMLWVNYLAYSKLRRSGGVDRTATFESWLSTTVSIQNLNADGDPSDETMTAGPTRPELVAG